MNVSSPLKGAFNLLARILPGSRKPGEGKRKEPRQPSSPEHYVQEQPAEPLAASQSTGNPTTTIIAASQAVAFSGHDLNSTPLNSSEIIVPETPPDHRLRPHLSEMRHYQLRVRCLGHRPVLWFQRLSLAPQRLPLTQQRLVYDVVSASRPGERWIVLLPLQASKRIVLT